MLKNYFTIILLLLVFACTQGCSKKNESEIKLESTVKDTSAPVRKEPVTEVKPDTSSNNNESSGEKQQQEISSQTSQTETKKAPAKISPLKASEHLGEYMLVEGFVADVFRSEKVNYLNFVSKFPKNPFTAVIFMDKADLFNVESYEGKTVEVKGKITEYKGKPQIILNSPEQIRIIK